MRRRTTAEGATKHRNNRDGAKPARACVSASRSAARRAPHPRGAGARLMRTNQPAWQRNRVCNLNPSLFSSSLPFTFLFDGEAVGFAVSPAPWCFVVAGGHQNGAEAPRVTHRHAEGLSQTFENARKTKGKSKRRPDLFFLRKRDKTEPNGAMEQSDTPAGARPPHPVPRRRLNCARANGVARCATCAADAHLARRGVCARRLKRG